MEDGRTLGACLAAVAVEREVECRTLKRYWQKVSGRPADEWLAALLPAYKGREPDEVDPRVLNRFFADYGRVEQPQAQACYERVRKAAAAGGWGPVPSLKTLQRRFNDLPAAQKVYLREGNEALDALYPHQERDRSGMRALDGLNMDSRIWDLRVQLPDARILRPVVTVVQDEASNAILAWEVTETESGQSYRRVMCRAFEHYGLPDQVRFDNTRAAANKATTGGTTGRFRFTLRPDELPGLLPCLGVNVSFTRPRNGRAKLIERAFAELKERSEKDPACAGAYTGRSPTEKPANYSEKAVPLATFVEVLTKAVEHYNTRADRRSTVAYQTSHLAVFEKSLKTRAVRKLTAEQRRLFFYSAKRVTPKADGTVFLGTMPRPHRYFHAALQDYAYRHPGEPIVVRYDENDFSAAIVAETVEGRRITGDVERIEAGAFNSVEAAKHHARARREANRATKHAARQYARMDEIEAGIIAAAVEASPVPASPPEASVIQITPNRRARSADAPAFPKRDPAKLAAARAALGQQDPEPLNTDGPDYRRLALGREKLGLSKAG
ncbi:transposase domain-containing protein [Methylobacterium sp. sgz302541]|uniref:transposase domain-containing protein n=1 Tax=unclassified Methylobacterium TaxID=2615210 RepID=UPI003D32AA1B